MGRLRYVTQLNTCQKYEARILRVTCQPTLLLYLPSRIYCRYSAVWTVQPQFCDGSSRDFCDQICTYHSLQHFCEYRISGYDNMIRVGRVSPHKRFLKYLTQVTLSAL